MLSLYSRILILSLLAQWATAMSQGMMASGNQSTISFPRLPPDFKEMARKLMITCSKKGYQVPVLMDNSLNSSYMMENPISFIAELLSSIPQPFPSHSTLYSNETADEQNPIWNITEKIWDCTDMGHLIELTRDIPGSHRCFMQAFVAPLSWIAIVQNGTDFVKEDLVKLIWAAKPFLVTMPPSNFSLPPISQISHLAEMMKMFSEVFNILSEEQRNAIIGWVRERVAEKEFACLLKPPVSSAQPPKLQIGKPTNQQNMSVKKMQSKDLDESNDKERKKWPTNEARPQIVQGEEGVNPSTEKQKAKPAKVDKKKEQEVMGKKGKMDANEELNNKNKKDNDLPFQKCPPGMPWLKAKVLTMMGPFLSRLPIEDVKNIPKEELCEFFRAPDFSPIFHNISGMHPALGRTLFQRLKQECSSGDNFTQNMDRLGSLACFYEDAQHLNVTLSKKLLYQLDTCDNSEIDKVKRQLVQKILDNNDGSYTQEILQSLGSAVSVLPLSKLYRFTSKDLYNSLPSLSKAKWNPAQAKTLAKKLLGEAKNITGEKLLSLGSMVRGVGSDFLKKVKAEGLLGNQVLEYLSEKMSSLQKKALVEAFRRDVNASELVKGLSDSLLPSLSLSMLEKADLSSVDQLEGRGWTHAQSTFLLKKILGNNISLNELRKLGQAVQGVTCEMIERVNRSNALEMAQTLTKSSEWLSRDQMRCAAQKLFASLEEQRPGYFSDIRNSELQAIPAMLLIHLPVEKIQNLSDAVCSAFIEKMNQVNLSCLPNSSPARNALTRRALSCLRANTTDLSASEVLSLGPLVCELSPAWMSSLNPVALNSTLQALASCLHIRQQYREHLFRLLTDTYGDPSYWSEDVMRALGPLLLLNDTAVEKLPSNSWLKSYLSDLIGSLPCQPMVPPPKEFSSWLDLSALQRKLFDLKTANTVQGRRKREVVPTLQPTLPVIEDLGQWNVYWSPTQLYKMSVQTFKDAMPTLGEITNYSEEQLAALKSKILEAWVSVTMLNESQIVELGCISQSFSPEELRNLSITSLDTLELLTICNFTQAQRAAVWQAFEKGTRISVPGLGDLEMVGLGQFICGLQLTQVDQLNSTQFREAVEVVGRAPCPMNITERLKEKAVAAFGKPETWSEAQVGIMGNIMAGLSTVELGRLNSTVMPFIQWSTIPLIPPDRLAALSLNQLKALGPDNAAMVTEAQRTGLRVDQRAAVDEAVGVKTLGAEVSSGTSTAPLPQKGGAPVQRMAEYVVLMQAIMLMMLGYIR